MMVQYEYAINENGHRVNVLSSPKGCEYFCVECGDLMYATSGDVQSPHFRHKHIVCGSKNIVHEGPLHYNTKFLVYDYIKYFFDNNQPLFINVLGASGHEQHINILELATSVNCEVSLSSKYRPDVSITGGRYSYAIEIIHTHGMSTGAINYVNKNGIRVITVETNEPFLNWLKVSFDRKYNFIFRHKQHNIKFILHNDVFSSTYLKCFEHFGLEQYNKLKLSIERHIHGKYEMDAFVYMEKKRNEFIKSVNDVYIVLELYENDAHQFIEKQQLCLESDIDVAHQVLDIYGNDAYIFNEKKHNDFLIEIKPIIDVLDGYDDDCTTFKNKCSLSTGTDLTALMRGAFKDINEFRKTVLKTGMVTPNMERRFIKANAVYGVYGRFIHNMTKLANAHGWSVSYMARNVHKSFEWYREV